MTRGERIDRLRAEESWDLLVIGGGATGLGTAVDATQRGYRTLLLEAFDFAKGTSSRSTKLVHGGVRYLAMGDIALVREALHERALLVQNAPHLVHELAFLIPAYSWWSVPYYGMGLSAYDLLAGRRRMSRTRAVSRSEALRLAPTLEPERLRGGVVYSDGQFDDARLAVALLRTFESLSGLALNYVPVTGVVQESGRVAGATARDTETGAEFTIKARAVVNASGVFADRVRAMDDAQAPAVIRPSQGTHLVLDRAFLPGETAIMIPKTDDGRVLFAIPWHGRTLVGTTDTPVESLAVEPRPLAAEIEFLLSHAARYLSRDPGEHDVLSTFAGLRPLISNSHAESTAKLSREHALLISKSGLITITGGKWTTYRRMGADAVNRAAEVADLPRRPCATESLHLHGWHAGPANPDDSLAVYGADAEPLTQLCAERSDWGERLHPALPYRAGEAVWAARHESARTVEDVLSRRTRALLLNARASMEAAPRVAALLAEELGFDADWQRSQVEAYRQLALGYVLGGQRTVAAKVQDH